jgi:hypothetical protein
MTFPPRPQRFKAWRMAGASSVLSVPEAGMTQVFFWGGIFPAGTQVTAVSRVGILEKCIVMVENGLCMAFEMCVCFAFYGVAGISSTCYRKPYYLVNPDHNFPRMGSYGGLESLETRKINIAIPGFVGECGVYCVTIIRASGELAAKTEERPRKLYQIERQRSGLQVIKSTY